MEELNKYQLIDGMINDLGNENNGVQVRGYRNVSIIKGVIEALVRLQNGLKQDEEFVRKALVEKDETIAKLQAEITELRSRIEPAETGAEPDNLVQLPTEETTEESPEVPENGLFGEE